MPPKGLSIAQKQGNAVTWIRSTRTVHTLKELEKALPSVASVNGMQVKDFITGLQNENMITVEKIGSGNWYWNFASDEIKSREATLEKLRADEQKMTGSIEGMRTQLGQVAMSAEEKAQHQLLMVELETGKTEVTALDAELDGFRDGDPVELEKKMKEGQKLKALAYCVTDNIHVLEQKIAEFMSGDVEQLDAFKRETYGNEYAEEEGLKEWTD